MEIYETAKGVDQYIKMCEGYDNSSFSDIISKYLPKNSTLLEIGMGPGNDYAWLSKLYNVTGSDYSKEFLSRIKIKYPLSETIILDAIKLDTNRKFDSIFSSKVFQHFDFDQLALSLRRQSEILHKNGIICHAFWVGDKEFDMENIHFIYHDKKKLIKLIEEQYTILQSIVYKEFEENDSLFIIARKR